MLTRYFQTAVSFDAQTKREAAGGGGGVGGRRGEAAGRCLSQRWALTEILYTCDLTRSPLIFVPPLFQHFGESVFRSS